MQGPWTPKPIAFDDLDFNLGERWIPKGVYERFASSLFDTEVKITFASNLDEYGVKAEATNVKITEQYAVSAQTRKYNGLHLLKHALQNTSPDITKTVLKWVDGERREVKVRDGEAIQLANSKIDEIRAICTAATSMGMKNTVSIWLRMARRASRSERPTLRMMSKRALSS